MQLKDWNPLKNNYQDYQIIRIFKIGMIIRIKVKISGRYCQEYKNYQDYQDYQFGIRGWVMRKNGS